MQMLREGSIPNNKNRNILQINKTKKILRKRMHRAGQGEWLKVGGSRDRLRAQYDKMPEQQRNAMS